MADNTNLGSHNNSIKRERFIRIAESRVNKVLDGLENLNKCSNKANYEYTDEEVRKIFREIEKKVKETKHKFQSRRASNGKFIL